MPIPSSPNEKPGAHLPKEILKTLEDYPKPINNIPLRVQQIIDSMDMISPPFPPDIKNTVNDWSKQIAFNVTGVYPYSRIIPNSEFDKVQEAVETEISKAEPEDKDELRHLQIQLLRLQIAQYPDLHKLSSQTVKAAKTANIVAIVAAVFTLIGMLCTIYKSAP